MTKQARAVTQPADAKDRWIAAHQSFVGNGAGGTGGAPAFLRALRAAAIERFAELGFPTTRQEEWRFTSVRPIAETVFAPAQEPPAALPSAKAAGAFEVCEARRHLAVFVNGHFAPSLSSVSGLPAGARIGSLRDAMRETPELVEAHLSRYARLEGMNPFAALNTAFLSDGAFVYLPANTVMEEPVQLLFLAATGPQPVAAHPRALVVVEPMARAAIVETFGSVGEGAYWTNVVTEIAVGDGARVDYYRVQREAEDAYHTAVTQAHQGRDSQLSVHPVVLGAELARHDINAVLDGTGGQCTLNGLYLLRGRQHADHHTTIDHAQPHCESHEYMNGVLDDRSRGVFNGRIIVRPGAQRTDSKQTNNNLVLSDQARADSQPQLEIYADDVKCTHGATLGPLDEQALFYLKSRGLGAAEARSLLTYGFGAEILDRMTMPPLRAQLDRLVRARLLGARQPRAA